VNDETLQISTSMGSFNMPHHLPAVYCMIFARSTDSARTGRLFETELVSLLFNSDFKSERKFTSSVLQFSLSRQRQLTTCLDTFLSCLLFFPFVALVFELEAVAAAVVVVLVASSSSSSSSSRLGARRSSFP